MNEVVTWPELFMQSILSLGERILSTLPSIFGAIAILLIGWLFAKLLASLAKKILQLVKIDELAKKIKADELIERAGIKKSASEIIAKFLYWIVLLLVFVTAADTLGWNAVTYEISKLITWLPSLLAALVFFIVGLYLAGFIKDIIQGTTASLGIGAGRIIGSVVYYLLGIMVTITSLGQAGLDTTVLESNLILILGSILLAAAISYGWASREVLANIISTSFGKDSIKVGDLVTINGYSGQLIEINKVNIVLLQKDGTKVVIPSQALISNSFLIHPTENKSEPENKD